MKPNINKRVKYIVLALVIFPACIYAGTSYNQTLPEYSGVYQAEEEVSFSDYFQEQDLNGGSIYNHWNENFHTNDRFGESYLKAGPPTEGGGPGDAVGAPVTDGIIPMLVAGLLYIFYIGVKRARSGSVKN